MTSLVLLIHIVYVCSGSVSDSDDAWLDVTN